MQLSGAKLLFVHSSTAEAALKTATNLKLPVVMIDHLPEIYHADRAKVLSDLLASCTGESLSIQQEISSEENLFTLPFSSGTTGVPKGTMLTHRNIIANILQAEPGEGFFMTTEDRLMCPLPFFHIYGMVVSLFLSLKRGCPLVFLPSFSLEKFLYTCQKYQVTRAHVVPPILILLAKDPTVSHYNLQSLKVLLSAAAPLDGQLEQLVADRLGVKVKQAWGMTELSPLGTIVADNELKPGSGTIGRLVPSTQAKILNSSMQPVSIGEEGELCIKGPQVMKGYIGNPAATASMFTQDGFLLTGDVCKADAEGYFYITERVKELIKYKGFQVAPAELEALLLSHPDIKDALVIGVPQDEAGEVPRAYIVLKSPGTCSEEAIHQFVNDKVGNHKRLRGGIVFRSSVPKTSSGKLLRKNIRAELLKEKQ